MAVEAHHPDYENVADDWLLVRHAIEGESIVKEQSETYLPKPSGFTKQDDGGDAMYASYMIRGKFPEIMGPTLRGMVGIIHRVPAEIKLPQALEPLRQRCTTDKLPLDALHERITYELLAMGRFGLLVDMPEEGTPEAVPFIAGYKAETIINWDKDGSFFVLDETHDEREEFDWIEQPQFRVLEITKVPEEEEGASKGEGESATETQASSQSTATAEGGGGGGGEGEGEQGPPPPGVYIQQVWKNMTNPEPWVEPQMKGGDKFPEIPFVVVGSTDVTPEIDEIPLIGVARCAFNMYRLDVDYKWQLFMSGQETLFVYTNSEQAVKVVGAGVVINLPLGSQAEYIGPSGTGINAHKEAIADERMQAVMAGARILDTERRAVESGDALKIRWAAQTASLTTIALNSAKGLERALKYAARFIGANEDEVVVKPNLDFLEAELNPQDAKALMELWMGGAISRETLYWNLQRGGIAEHDRTIEDEVELIDQEIPDITTPASEAEKAKIEAEAAAAPPRLREVPRGGTT